MSASVWGAEPNKDLLEIIRHYEDEFNLPYLLQAIAEYESSYNPYALNVDGLQLYPTGREQALSMIASVEENPYLVRVQLPDGRARRMLFPSEEAARVAISELRTTEPESYRNIVPANDGEPFRQLSVDNTDLCAMQINYYWNGRHFDDKSAMLDSDTCVRWAAQYLRQLIDQHGVLKGLGCYHNCGDKPHQVAWREAYVSRVRAIFTRIVRENEGGLAYADAP